MKDTDIMIFGKHKGKMLGEIPADYMLWLYDEMKEKKGPFAKELTEYLKENIEYYKQQIDAKTD
jgi:uncharacterized protein (DUF3820 family)